NGRPAELLDRPQTSDAIVEIPGQDNTDRVRAEYLGGRTEHRIDRWSETMLARALRDTEPSRLNDQMAVGWSDVDMPGFEPLPIARLRDRQRGETLENLCQHTS